MAIAIPSILVIALVMLTMKEPPRAASHRSHHPNHGASPATTAHANGVIPVEETLTEVDDEDDEGGEEEQGPSLARNGCSIQLRKFMDVFVIRTNLLAFCQSLPGCLPWGCVVGFLVVLGVFVPTLSTPTIVTDKNRHRHRPIHSVISAFLTDFLHEQRGMSVEGATALMFVFGIGCFAGNLAGGILGQVRVRLVWFACRRVGILWRWCSNQP